ncbi:hypothetical protein GV054_01040 [Marinomonas mediterranea]|jgi:hypothetical protein|uniref:Uncharacterized protein n=1 Tax=Marinomonas mediterranea (strain ATCC 700492 / JCM 21426 / NBRC 103028 / MMB-1) TaxID=717774 RepID=F2JWC0_MARM1|nr:hypothetical protein [Marinomonas mediterranea]ADZ89508.1 hypothetical protein Marme_0204 [Marinomonas mediterranea MMB-1]WCN11705.1 hypothetical protein GV054_01040 [Marinomonas mediterranea]WCN15754.1 hypothetical protein GV053_01005 [Marinomonas mediterranea MMB-1]
MDKGFCHIEGYEPSSLTLSVLDDIERVSRLSKVLEFGLAGTPLFQIFAGRSSYSGTGVLSAGWNATTYDWKLFQSALSSVSRLRKGMIYKHASMAYLRSIGKDKKFWRCVANAAS